MVTQFKILSSNPVVEACTFSSAKGKYSCSLKDQAEAQDQEGARLANKVVSLLYSQLQDHC